MFTIEHDFDATVVTLVDEGDHDGDATDPEAEGRLREDVIVTAFDDCVTVAQYDPRRDETLTITLSLSQLADLRAALDLPEGVYRRMREADGGV